MSDQQETPEHLEAVAIVEHRAIDKVMAMREQIKSLRFRLRALKKEVELLRVFEIVANKLEIQRNAADELAMAANKVPTVNSWVWQGQENISDEAADFIDALAAYQSIRGKK